jgi:D-isomer specific 2-hydroxyacid dehydrogenase, NAD binding domain
VPSVRLSVPTPSSMRRFWLAHRACAFSPSGIAAPDVLEIASASDVLTLHVPLTDETHYLVDKAFLNHVRPGTILINCGRGVLVDLDAALAALELGQLGGVGLEAGGLGAHATRSVANSPASMCAKTAVVVVWLPRKSGGRPIESRLARM